MTDERRRLLAEFLGTCLLVAIVVGSGISAQSLSKDVGLELLENALATAAGLAALILVFSPISGAHFNPVVSLADWFFRRRSRSGFAIRELLGYVVAQTGGAIAGAILANAMFARSLVAWSTHHRGRPHLLLGEVVATAGPLLVIFALDRNGRANQTPWVVGAYIGAAYFFTSSTSFANPAVSIGRAFTDTFAGIAPDSLPGFIAAQLIGAGLAVLLITPLYPLKGEPAEGIVIDRGSKS